MILCLHILVLLEGWQLFLREIIHFHTFPLVDNASKNCVLQQLLGKKKLTVYTAPNWMEVKPKPVVL